MTSGGEITSQCVNASSSRVAGMFRDARNLADKYGLAVIFIDEIDAVLPSRQAHGRHGEDKKVTNEFLKHLDSCTEEHVIVIGTTNYRDDLDDAAVRPGRMDLQAEVPPPNKAARVKIIEAQLEDRATGRIGTAELEKMSEHQLEGATAADITHIVEEAALLAANAGEDTITSRHLWKAVEETMSD